MGTVATSTLATATAYGNQRKIDRCQNGVLWEVLSGVPGRGTNEWSTRYSTDGGTTWSAGDNFFGGSNNNGTAYTMNGALCIDPDDFASFVMKDGNNGFMYVVRGTPNAARTAYTWSAAVEVSDSTTRFDYPDIWVHREGSGWKVHIVANFLQSAGNNRAWYRPLTIASGGAITPGGDVVLSAVSSPNPTYPSIDGRHTGDAKTVATISGAPQPDLFVGWSNGQTGAGYGIRFRKAVYATGSWTWGTEREIDSAHFWNGVYIGLTHFDGSRIVITGEASNGSSVDLILHDRDAADTTTTARTLLNLSDATQRAAYGSSGYDTAGNVYIFGRRIGGSNPVSYRKWTRATQTLGAFVDLANGAYYPSVRRGSAGQAIDYVMTVGEASPYTVTSGRISLNQNPTAATPLTPADNATIDSSVDATVTFQHNDPDGDAASSWRIRYRPAGTSIAYAYLTGSSTAANGATITATVPANTWPGQIEWAVQTYDPSGAEGAWSVTRTVRGRPASLAALTGGQGGTSLHAPTLLNMVQSERALRALSLV